MYSKERDKRNSNIEKEMGIKIDKKEKDKSMKSYESTNGKSKTMKKSIGNKTSTNGFKMNKSKGECSSPLRKRKDSGNSSSVSPEKSMTTIMDGKELVYVT